MEPVKCMKFALLKMHFCDTSLGTEAKAANIYRSIPPENYILVSGKEEISISVVFMRF